MIRRWLSMRTLVTGAGGQVGHALVRALAAEGHEVHASDIADQPRSPEAVDAPWIHLDVTDARAVQALLSSLRPQVVFHLAAILSAGAERNPQAAYRVNQTGTYNLLEGCRQARVPQLFFTSSIAVFGPGLPNPVTDDAPQRPTTLYGITKVAGELLGEYYHRRYGLDFRGVRFPGLISASLPGSGTSDYALYMYVDGVRCGAYQAYCRPETRIPLMYMPDAIRAMLELSRVPRTQLKRSIYNIAAFHPTAGEIAQRVTAALPEARITFKPDPVRQAILDSWPRMLDDRPARQEWGWRPRFGLEEMTGDLIPRIHELLARHAHALDHDDSHEA